jgi:hypothetical protein
VSNSLGWLVITVYGDDAWDRPEFATVELTKNLLEWMEKMTSAAAKFKEEIKDFFRFEAWDYAPDFHEIVPEEFDDYAYEGWTLLSELPGPPGEAMGFEYMTISVTPTALYWKMRPKGHCYQYSTQEITLSNLKEALSEEIPGSHQG